MGKNVAVFVDVANLLRPRRPAWTSIRHAAEVGHRGRDLVRAYAYTGLDPDNENQQLHSSGADLQGRQQDIRKYGDGKVKANLDISSSST